MAETAVASAVVAEIGGETSSPRAGRRARAPWFFVGIAGALFLLVLLGFSRTLYLRALFDVPDIPRYLIVHGIVLTTWFAVMLAQAGLVAARRPLWHRRLGWLGAAVGVGVVAVGLRTSLGLVPRLIAAGADVQSQASSLALIVLGDLALVASFSVFLVLAVAYRRRADVHKRLMTLASISILAPALARIWRWSVFGGADEVPLSIATLLGFVAALWIYDSVSRGRPHPASVLGGLCFFVSIGLAVWVASSTLGQTFVLVIGGYAR